MKDKKNSVIKYIVIAVAMIVSIVFMLSPFFIKCLVPNDKIPMEVADFMSTLITNIFVIFGVVVALWQYISYTKSEMEIKNREAFERDKDRIQKAIDLSGYFKDSIMANFEVILFVYQNCGVLDILNKISSDKMIRFDSIELNNVLPKNDLDKIQKKASTKEFNDALSQYCMVNEKWENCVTYLKNDEGSKIVEINGSVVRNKFNAILNDVLNSLEFFSMHFIHETADESVVYQSLHSVFLLIVRTLYYDISINNSGLAEQKIYTKTIELYQMWSEHSKAQAKEEHEATNEHIHKGKKLERQ